MEDSLIDLHLHTNYSDGIFTPEELILHAKKIRLSAIAITDHDITDGIQPAIEKGLEAGIEVIPGIELSVECAECYQQEMHILGYFMDWKNPGFQEHIRKFRDARKVRAHEILDKLAANGILLDRDKFFSENPDKSIGRLHIARSLVSEGFVANIRDAFNKYLSANKPAYVKKFQLSPLDALQLIKENKGLSSIAHPHYLGKNYESIIKSLIEFGLDGLEVWHTMHTEAARKKFIELAGSCNLIITGGSDCHGLDAYGSPSIGNQQVPYDVLVELKKRHNSITPNSTTSLSPST